MNPVLGVLLKVGSTLAFTLMQALVKTISDRYPVGEIVFFRSFFALIPVFIWAGVEGRLMTVFVTDWIGQHFIRTFVGGGAMALGFAAVHYLPLADATAIGYACPLMTVVLAAVFLREHVRIYRWTAVAVGFIGVLIVVSDYVAPGDGEAERSALGVILALAGALGAAFAAIQVRRLTKLDGSTTIVVYFSLFTALLALLTLPFGWKLPGPADAAVLVSLGIIGGIGQVLMTHSFRHADASILAPFDYISLLWAVALSMLMFADYPTSTMLFGSAIIVASGLFVVYREHRQARERARAIAEAPPVT